MFDEVFTSSGIGIIIALRILDLGLLSHPGTPELRDLRQGVLQRLVERHQLLNPFKFVYYAGLADLELASALPE